MKNIDIVLTGLESEEEQTFKESLKVIREEGDISIIPQLFRLLKDTSLTRRRHQAILELLSNVRDPGFPDLLATQIKEEEDFHLKAELIKICWETPVNMYKVLPLLVEILNENEFETAMEASTAIEEQLRFASEESIKELEELLDLKDPASKPFIDDILAAIKNRKERLKQEKVEEPEENKEEN